MKHYHFVIALLIAIVVVSPARAARTIYVDGSEGGGGSDTQSPSDTAGTENTPFKSLRFAKLFANYVNTDPDFEDVNKIWVKPAQYRVDWTGHAENNLLLDGVDWHFEDGAEVISEASGSVPAIFDDNGSPVTCTITGKGEFTSHGGSSIAGATGVGGNVIEIIHPDSHITIACKKLVGLGSAATVFHSGGRIDITECDEVYSEKYDAIWLNGDTSFYSGDPIVFNAQQIGSIATLGQKNPPNSVPDNGIEISGVYDSQITIDAVSITSYGHCINIGTLGDNTAIDISSVVIQNAGGNAGASAISIFNFGVSNQTTIDISASWMLKGNQYCLHVVGNATDTIVESPYFTNLSAYPVIRGGLPIGGGPLSTLPGTEVAGSVTLANNPTVFPTGTVAAPAFGGKGDYSVSWFGDDILLTNVFYNGAYFDD